MFANNEFENKLVLVTGASRGIGKAIAEGFATLGATVIGTATSEAGAKSITENLAKFSKALNQDKNLNKGLVLDIAKKESIKDLLDNISADFNKSGPDILVNNAGITNDNLVLRMKDEEWENVINTDLNGLFYLTKLCVKSMIKSRWGRIINIGSVVGNMGNPGQVNYCAAKAGILGLTKALAKEIGSRAITVNVVAPGYIDTDMTSSMTEEQKRQLAENIPLGRVGNALDVANSVVFLGSTMADYITGQTIHVNGGMYMN
jgi:3-oxoacyl-[acyl-carrier protein] reductase